MSMKKGKYNNVFRNVNYIKSKENKNKNRLLSLFLRVYIKDNEL
jgi:hypothetical protein